MRWIIISSQVQYYIIKKTIHYFMGFVIINKMQTQKVVFIAGFSTKLAHFKDF